ncbi:unnamed protein product, partial [Lepidochelys kempii]
TVSHGSDHRIPRLEDVFQKFPHIPVNVEINEDDEELIRQVADLVRRYRRSTSPSGPPSRAKSSRSARQPYVCPTP